MKRSENGYRKVPLIPLWVKPDRWPGQNRPRAEKYGWKIRQGLMGRFGGGWDIELGIKIGGSTIILSLILGILRITWVKPALPEKIRQELLENLQKDDLQQFKKDIGKPGHDSLGRPPDHPYHGIPF